MLESFYLFIFIHFLILINLGRVCHGSYHWRCVKPERISHLYGGNNNYICNKCNDDATINSSQRLSNGSSRTKSLESFDINYRDFVSVPSKTSSIESSVENTIRNFEDQPQQESRSYKTTEESELDDYLPSQTNENEYHHQNGKM